MHNTCFAECTRKLSGTIHRRMLCAIVMAVVAMLPIGQARSDEPQFPNWKGQWTSFRMSGVTLPLNQGWDPTKAFGVDQQAPLTDEYKAVWLNSIREQIDGGVGNFPSMLCRAQGMPAVMMAYQPLEFITTPDVTYILINNIDHTRRIFTDGRDWPDEMEPTFQGYSIGRWIDEDGDGRYDVLQVETRGFKGPRAYEASGLPLHHDNQSIILERLYLDPANPNELRNEVIVIDHALTHPWAVEKKYIRNQNARPNWPETICGENNEHVHLGGETYMLSADELSMPTRKGQPSPDLKYFKQSGK